MSSGMIAAVVVGISVVLLIGGAVAGYKIARKTALERERREANRHSSQQQGHK